jgi:hypothetical protein
MSSPGKLKSTILIIAPLIVGAVLRLLAGDSILFANLVYAPSGRMRYPGNRTPEEVVKTFYLAVDRGDYSKAYENILEPDWTVSGQSPAYRESVEPDPDNFRTWTSEQEFVHRLENEMGVAGYGIKLSGIEARLMGRLDPDRYREMYGLSDLQEAYRVVATGHILGACSLFNWRKELVVLQIGKTYRVLLSGAKRSSGLFYQTWFSDIESAGTIRPGRSKPEGTTLQGEGN